MLKMLFFTLFSVPPCIHGAGKTTFAKKVSEEFDSNLVKNTVYQVLNEKSFLSNILEFSKKSKDQNGCLNAYNLILKHIS